MKRSALVLAVAIAAAPSMASARAGDLDTGFAGGVVYAGFPYGAAASALDVDGSTTVVAGGAVSRRGLYDVAVARFTSKGTLDQRFSGDGRAYVDMGGIEFAVATSIAKDDSVTTALLHIPLEQVFESDCCTLSAAVSKLDARGKPVKGFGTDGIAPLEFVGTDDSSEFVFAIEAVGTGVIVAGTLLPAVTTPEPLPTAGTARGFVAKLGPDGAFDPTFGTGGVTYLPPGAPSGVVDMMTLSDGSIIVAGWDASLSDGFVIHKLTSLGLPDPTFGPGGVVITDAGSRALPAAITPGPSGTFIVAGAHASGQWVVSRYRADGTPDTGFGGDGMIKVLLEQVGAPRAVGWSAGMLYVVAGRRSCTFICVNEGIVGRIKANGTMDGAFGTKGIAPIGFAMIEPAGLGFHGTKPVVSATSLGQGGDIALARLKS